MALNTTIVTILFITVVLSMFAIIIAFYIGWSTGWKCAKKLYYDDLKEEKRKEEQLATQESKKKEDLIAKENSNYIPISADLLIAYGVNTVGGLPKSVREAYNISDEMNHLDIDTLNNMERDKEV